MCDKKDEFSYDDEDDFEHREAGFEIRLPFGFGWLRGDSTHLTAILPVIRWAVMSSTILYLILKIVEAHK